MAQSHAALRQACRSIVPDRTVGLSQVAARNAELHSSGIERHVRRRLRRALQRVQQAAVAVLTRRVAEPHKDRRLNEARDAGGAEIQALSLMRKHFAKVHHIKPDASRKESVEGYVIATGYKV